MRKTANYFLVVAVGAALIAAIPARAQNYPNKPIHVIVPVPPAALTDVIARKIANEASAKMGQPWIMENKSGANFIPAAETCHHATGDGYTLCIFTTSTLTFNPHLIENIPYNAETDFIPIINLGMFTGGLVASPKLGVKNIDELRKLALAKPGELNFGTYGPSSSANVFRQYMNDKWKTNIVEVGYKGANELVAALISGEIQMTWTALGNWADNPNNSKGFVLVQDSGKRSVKMPDVPTYAEVGFGDYPIHTWMALFAPRGTPPEIVAQINKVVGEAINQPAMTAFLINQVIDPAVTSPQEFAASIVKERNETGEVFRRFNIPKIK
ncbi:MAG: Bug family tripartite tricarboxylate transporter substrate binding protein [Xanthobacteraceae bacterium]